MAALSPDVNSRFLVAPRRYTRQPDGNLRFQPHAIACGLMGGFGGFLSVTMRAHDYQLGRLNAYRFLKLHFAFPRDNKVIEAGYTGVRDPARFGGNDAVGVPAGQDAARFQMIPVMDTVEQPDMPAWPRVSQREVDEFVRAAGARAMALADSAAGSTASWVARQLGLRSVVEDFVRWTLMKELYLRAFALSNTATLCSVPLFGGTCCTSLRNG